MENNLSASSVNELFLAQLNSPEGIEKVSQSSTAYVRNKLREVSFARKILPPQYVTRLDLTRSVNHDGLVKIVDVEPDSSAMIMNLRGNPATQYLMGDRFEIPFFTVTSPDFQKTEEELLAYDMPMTEIIEKNSVLDIQRQEDGAFINTVIAAADLAGNSLTGSSGYELDSTDGFIPKQSFESLFALIEGSNELKVDTILMAQTTFNKMFLYPAEQVGANAASELFYAGGTHPTLFGKNLIVTNKYGLVGDKIFAFAAADYLGQFLVLNDVKFWLDKQKNIITFALYETIGMGLSNANKGVAYMNKKSN